MSAPTTMLRFLEAGRSASSSASTGEAGLAKPRAVSGSAGTACVCVPVWPAGSTAGLLGAGLLGAGLGLMTEGSGGSTAL
jgi:anti-sigma factor RsiW